MVTALGRAWHPEHFLCSGCSTTLGGSSFFEKDGAPFCPECYFERFSPRCGFCNQPIRHVSSADSHRLTCFREDQPNGPISSTYLHARPTLPLQFSLFNPKFLVSSSAFPSFSEGDGGKKAEKVSVVSFFILCRKWLRPWAPTGTQNISAASAAGSLLEKRVRAET